MVDSKGILAHNPAGRGSIPSTMGRADLSQKLPGVVELALP